MLLLLTSDFDPFLLCILDAKREPNKDDLSHLVTVTVDLNRICVLRSSFPKNVVPLVEDWSFEVKKPTTRMGKLHEHRNRRSVKG